MEFQKHPEYEIMSMAQILLFEGEAVCLHMILDYVLSNLEILIEGRVEGSARDRLLSLVRDRDVLREDVEDAERAIGVMRQVEKALGKFFPEQGQVPHGQYERVKGILRQGKEQAVDHFACTEQDRIAWRKAWPFDD
jgi:hypothetical protein